MADDEPAAAKPKPKPEPADEHAWWSWPWRQVGYVFRDAFGLVRGNWKGITAFGAGVLVGVLLVTVAANGLPFTGDDDEDLDGDTLVVLSGVDDSPHKERDRLIQTWNRLHPDMKAEIQPLSSTADKQHSTMVTRAQAAEPDVDVYNLDVVWMAEFADNGWIRPLKDVDTSGFLAKPLDTCRYQGKLWALPFNTDAGLLYFREAELEKRGVPKENADLVANPPKSWETLSRIIDTAFAGTRPAGDRLRAGYTAQFDDYEGLTVNAMEAIWAKEGDVVDADGKVTLDSDAAQSALQELAQAYQSSRTFLTGSDDNQEPQSRDAFGRGEVLFMRNWPLAYRQLTAPRDETAVDPRSDQAAPDAKDIQVTSLPGPSALGGQNLAVSSKSRHAKAAQQLVEFLTGETSQQILFQDGGYAATRQRIYEDPYIRANYGYAQTLLQAVKGAKLRPVTPHYDRFSAEFRRIVREILRTGRDVQPADVKALNEALEGKPE